MENAIGIGFNQMSGTRQMAVGAATHMRSMQAGFSGQGAVLAAELARRGIIGSKEVVEGRYGIFKTYVRGNEPDWNAIVGGLGTRFPLLEMHGFKVWPACGYTRTTNAATLYLREKHGLRPEDVESITIVGGTGGTQQLCEPLERKRRPKTQHRRQVQHSVHDRGHDGERQRHAARLHDGGSARSARCSRWRTA